MTRIADSSDIDVRTALERCISVSPDEFASEHWGRKPLFSRASELHGGFEDLLDLAGVDELVSERGLRTPFLRMAKNGKVLTPDKFTRAGGAGATIRDQVADDKIAAMVNDGATLVLQGLHRTWPPLVDFTSRLSGELGCPAQVNAYITPPQNQGFKPHYDIHDVFALQVHGRKRWVIWEPVWTDPLDSQPWEQRKVDVDARAEQEPYLDIVLEPGDALYLPRGTIHAAEALGETTLHLTIGVHAINRFDLVKHLLDAVADDAQLRSSLPMGVDLSDPDVLAPHLEATVAALRDRLNSVSVADAAKQLGALLMERTRPEPIGPLAQLAAADQLQSDTLVRRRGNLRLRPELTVDEVRLVMLDRTVTTPVDAAPAVKLLLSGQPCTPADLPGLETEEQLTLVRRLLREGILVPAAVS